MHISFSWLKNFIDLEDDNLDSFLETLTLGGFEVEDFESENVIGKSDIVFDISTTANRSDTNSIVGFSLEIHNLFNKDFINPSFDRLINSIFNQKSFLPVHENRNFNSCSCFYGRCFHSVQVQDSPLWLQRRLLAAKINPVNSVVDLGNYMMLEWGQPVHIYDLNKINSLLSTDEVKIGVRRSDSTESLIGLNDQKFDLSSRNLVVTANDIPISIAGILGSKDTEVSESTTSIFVECAVFPPEIIRQSSKSCGLRTDAASTYIKGVNSTFLPFVFKRLSSLLNILCFAQPSSNSIIYNSDIQEELKSIKVRYGRVIKILGPIKSGSNSSVLDKETISSYFRQLGFVTKNFVASSTSDLDSYWEVVVPSIRTHDLEEEVDIIEEIGRIHGFNNFVSDIPYPKKVGKIYSIEILKRQFKSALINLGLFESIHYSLVPSLDKEVLLNPFSKDQSNLRPNLLNGLIKSSIQNFDQNASSLSAFEFGRVFIQNKESSISEHELVAGIMGGRKYRTDWSVNSDYETWYQAKAKIDEIFYIFDLSPKWVKVEEGISSNSFFHPQRTAVLSVDGIKFGMFGQIHPKISNEYSLSPQTYLFEFNVTNIDAARNLNSRKQYKSYSFYPVVSRDLNFLFDKSIEYKKIEDIINKNAGPFLKSIRLLDTYQNQNSKGINLTFNLQFQSFSGTLVTAEVDETINQIQNSLEENFSIS